VAYKGAPVDPLEAPRLLRLLILEDRPDDAELMLHALRRGGFQPSWQRVDTEADYAQALEAPLDLILADFNLPQFDAIQALNLLRSRQLDLPFIIVSGSVGEETAAAAMRSGAHDYVLKGNLARLAPAVERELRMHAERAAARAAQEEYIESVQRLASIVKSSVDAIISIDLDGRVVSWNPAAERLYGYSAAEALGRHISFMVPEEARDELGGLLQRIQAGEPIERVETVRRRKNGTLVEISTSVFPTLDERGAVVAITGMSRDLSARKRSEQALRASEERNRRIVETAFEGVWVIDADDRTTFVNQRLADMLGYRVDEMVGRPVSDFLDPQTRKAFAENLGRRRTGSQAPHEFKFLRKDGSELWTLLEASASVDAAGRYSGSLAMLTDVTERRRAEDAFQHQRVHDALTGLPNRVLLMEQLENGLRVPSEQAPPLSLLILDLDHFKEVNETFGHGAGDLLLGQVGPRLQDVLPGAALLARLGGDEFAVLLPDADQAGAAAAGARVLEAMDRPFEIEGQLLDMAASIGTSTYPADADRAETLIRRADIALFIAKRARGTCVSYAPEYERQGASRLTLMAELRQAIRDVQLRLQFQPLVSLHNGAVVGAEALVRWDHPERGVIPPAEFIPFAEKTRLIQPLTRWVLTSALRQSRSWHHAGHPLPVSVNISMRDLVDKEFPGFVANLLRDTQAQPSWLRLEITEGVIMAEPERAIDTLGQLKRLGVRLAVDDFGTGYSSLAYLYRLPVDELKIDKSFVQQMSVATNRANIVRASVDLGHSLRLETVAEGVEDARTWDLLVALGCDTAQGYYMSKPLAANDVLPWLARWQAAHGRPPDRGTSQAAA
jgi:diguanylate cyclase (GGDEF)-like protein/PAS domain S-box-containing protein